MTINKAILLLGGNGTRLLPITRHFNKHLIPLNQHFVIDYPLNTLKQSGIKEVQVVLGGQNYSQIVDYIRGGKDFGMKITYNFQEEADGIASAINQCQSFVENEQQFIAMLGDNIYSHPIKINKTPYDNPHNAKIILHKHSRLNDFGVVSVGNNSKIISIQEKPKNISHKLDNYAISGFYVFTKEYFNYFKNIKPSARGEFEITDIIKQYNDNGDLDYIIYNNFWNDAGTHNSLEECREYIKSNPIEFVK